MSDKKKKSPGQPEHIADIINRIFGEKFQEMGFVIIPSSKSQKDSERYSREERDRFGEKFVGDFIDRELKDDPRFKPKRVSREEILSRLRQVYEITKDPIILGATKALELEEYDTAEVLFSLVLVLEEFRMQHLHAARVAREVAGKIVAGMTKEPETSSESLFSKDKSKKGGGSSSAN